MFFPQILKADCPGDLSSFHKGGQSHGPGQLRRGLGTKAPIRGLWKEQGRALLAGPSLLLARPLSHRENV